jgi:hypothetical protein
MKTITATKHLTDDAVARLEGHRLDDSSFDTLVSAEDVTVLKPDGSPLLIYRHNVLPRTLCLTAFDVFRRVKVGTTNRGAAAGILDALPEINGQRVSSMTPMRYRRVKRDGSESTTSYAQKVPSATIGFMDRTRRHPYCRQTAFNLDHHAEFNRARPFIRAVDGVFQETVPDRYAAQARAVQATSPDFVIRDTAFSTVTVNHNFQTALHQDPGDLKEGFGVMSVLDAGHYEGGYLVFPQYRVGVDMRAGGVCLGDVHEWHANTPIVGREGTFLRCSLVFYYREHMRECGTARDENERARLLHEPQ